MKKKEIKSLLSELMQKVKRQEEELNTLREEMQGIDKERKREQFTQKEAIAYIKKMYRPISVTSFRNLVINPRYKISAYRNNPFSQNSQRSIKFYLKSEIDAHFEVRHSAKSEQEGMRA